jgi:drug/metabolite transporter (DMT)-like permease
MRNTLFIISALLLTSSLFGQSQELVQLDKEPVDFSNPWNIVLFIIFPIVLAVFYFWWLKQQRKERENK